MAQETTDRQSKNNVFVDLFSNKEYVYRLYREFHPEDVNVSPEDITVETLSAIIVNTLYNDLGFTVRDKLIMLVEAQSTWCPNIPLRMMFYLSETYRRYLDKTSQSEHNPTKVRLPKPELHVIYTGTRKVPEEISLSETFFGGDSPVDVRVKVFHSIDQTLCGQYVGFCQVFDEQRKIYDNGIECAIATIRICKERGYLVDYLTERETEVINMMEMIFNEELLRQQYDKALAAESEARGIAIGEARGELKGITQTAANLLKTKQLSNDFISKTTGLPLETINELAAALGV